MNKGIIIAGLIVFLVVVTIPLWYTSAAGGTKRAPLEMPVGEKQCVKDKAYMTGNHMQLLREWRDAVVREGKKFSPEEGGKTYEMSLVKTCLGCHSNKKAFCDRCHEYADVNPDCWNCHIEPEGK
ncbi:MAG: sulfate reduction electron transfer complex DsrMKJOP subunit DsrJ [Planctomycetota bacterium]|jgi:hypothetical protein